MKRTDVLKSSQLGLSNELAQPQTPNKDANHFLPTGSCSESGQALLTRFSCHQLTSPMEGAPYEHNDLAPFGAATRVRRDITADEDSLSRAKMWDPVKDCSDPSATQAGVSGFLSARHDNSQRSMPSTTNGSTSMGNLPFSPSSHPYGPAQDSQRQFSSSYTRDSTTTGRTSLHNMTSGYQANASLGILPCPQPQATGPVYQVNARTNAQSFQVGDPYDRCRRNYQVRPGYESASTWSPELRNLSGQDGQQSFDSTNQRAALMPIGPWQSEKLHDHAQEVRHPFTAMESRVPVPMISNVAALPVNPHTSTQRSDFQRVDPPQLQSHSADMSKAKNLARYAETLDQQQNRTEAMQFYEQACALFQGVIIRSSSLKERVECNEARNTCQARFEVLLRESAACPSGVSLGQYSQQEDDAGSSGKPQYSLYEDWILCRKAGDEVSWQDVASTALFKGKRKHRSLSQRKHTIGKMGPKYHEVEEPWTEEEDRKLCALGDAGKTLGDIHRKFRSRNAERCLDRYFLLRRPPTTGSPGQSRASRQACDAPALSRRSTGSMDCPSDIPSNPAHLLHPATSPINPVSGHSIGTALQPIHLPSRGSSQSLTSPFAPRGHAPEAPSLSPPSNHAETSNRFTTSSFLLNRACNEYSVRNRGSWGPSRYQGRSEATPSSSSSYVTSARSPNSPLSFTSSRNSPRTLSSPHESRDPPNSSGATTGNGVWKSR